MSQPKLSADSANIAYFALGSNVTSPEKSRSDTIMEALALMGGEHGELISQSRYFSTPAFPPGSGPDFVNAAAALRTDLPPKELLDLFHKIESELGRVRKVRWAPRSLDIDLIAYGDLVLPNREAFQQWLNLPLERQKHEAPDGLILPHPRLQDRSFVLVPLNDIAPNWCHPVLGKTVSQMLEDRPLAEKAEIKAIS